MTAQSHVLRTVEQFGVKLVKPLVASLEVLERANGCTHKAQRMMGAGQDLAKGYSTLSKRADLKAAETTDPEDFTLYRIQNPLPDLNALAEISNVFRWNRSAAQRGVEDAVRSVGIEKVFGSLEKAWLDHSILPDPSSTTVAEAAGLAAEAAEARMAILRVALWLAEVGGGNADEKKLIRATARNDGVLISLKSARDIRAGRTPEALAAKEAEAEVVTAKRSAVKDAAANNARARTLRREGREG